MTRYYFDIRQDDQWHRDEFGMELLDFAEARDQAIAILPDLAQEAVWSDDHHEVVCRVRDAAGGTLYEGELVFNGRWTERE